MSFSNLMNGAECSTSSNPLGQFSKHVGQDKSLQRDRLVPSGGASPQTMRTASPVSMQDRNVSFVLREMLMVDGGSVF